MFYAHIYPWAKPYFFSFAEHRETDFRKEEEKKGKKGGGGEK